MALFMLISGYLFRTAYFDTDGQIKKARMRRQAENLIMLYVIYDIAYGLFKILCSRFTLLSTTWSDILLFPIHPINPYWYLYILILYYAIFSRGPILRHSMAVLYITAVLCILSTFVSDGIFPLDKLLNFAFFFWLGVCCRHGTAAWFGRPVITAVLLPLSVGAYALRWTGHLPPQVFPVANMIIPLGIVQGLWYGFAHIPALQHSSLFSLFGKYSLEVYLIHCAILAGARTVFPAFIHDHYVLSIALNFALSASLPLLFAVLCKKLSIHDVFFKPVVLLERAKKV